MINKEQIINIIKEGNKSGLKPSGIAYLLKMFIDESSDVDKDPDDKKKLLKGDVEENPNELTPLGAKYDKKGAIRESIEDSLKLMGAGDAHFFCVEFVREDAGKNKALAGIATVINVNSKEEAEKLSSGLIPEPIKLLKICSPARFKDSMYLIDGKNKKVIEI